MRPIRYLFPLALLAGLSACPSRGAPPPPPIAAAPGAPVKPPGPPAPADDEPVLRTYAVAPEQSRSLERALSSALSTGKETPPLGTVERLPDGRLVVVARRGIHDGVAALIHDLDASKAPPVRSAEFDYWVVVAEPAEAAAGVDAVPDIAPALQTIVDSQGPMKFSVLETMRLSSLLDEAGEADGNRMNAHQVVSEVGGRLVADLEIAVAAGPDTKINRLLCVGDGCKRLKSRVHLEPDQMLVVGQTGGAAPGGKPEAAPKTMFYLVRGRLRTGGA
jgi:hypothetical protein